MTVADYMRQAHATADEYAREGAIRFERIFGCKPSQSTEAAAIFIGQYMRTAAHDFDVCIQLDLYERSKADE